MEIDLYELLSKLNKRHTGGTPDTYTYVQAMAAIMQADCAARTAAAAERQAKSLEILCDLLADAMTETANLTEQDEPTALHMGGNVLRKGVFTPWGAL